MRLMVTGGGTGGHTSPAAAIVEELSRRDPRLSAWWVGKRGAIEERVSASLGVPFRSVPAKAWPRTNRFKQFLVAGVLAWGFAASFRHLKIFRPNVVLGVGGYVSVPLILTAQRLGIPTILHEQNKRMGMANALLAKRADRLLLSFFETAGEFAQDRAKVVGNPVRAAFANPPAQNAARVSFGLEPSIPVVLVAGGSQGARTINRAIREGLSELGAEEFQLIWMTGGEDIDLARRAVAEVPARVEVFSFIDDMACACAAADLVISRAGASTTAELAVLGKPSILVPYPHAADDHQKENAEAFEKNGGAMVLSDSDCSARTLLDAIRRLISEPGRLAEMAKGAESMAKPAAVESIADEILRLVFSLAN
ncbi:MAG: undecaprenyldiphospho-muramoylpentapeptide beta-N-acetylglucosaminyltransferase [Candidatus Hydrogenedentes bacterium]|jgi:UDP-N-acetylglucosamine--N-acetylmuramyl-(pentapeptide) pyrophosphoryl-undecaprenol N-acetylglucosamine transferase|nr:undecaprenyldiphospho-muramoylpentapeptide beta-N-acetylglucosaminyltransferase [Candidatus Hydrogenedentota bacterium]